MDLAAIAAVVGIIVGFVSLYGVPEDKYPWVRQVRGWRSIPAWTLVVFPEFGKWLLRASHQDFAVTATGPSPLTAVFNFLTTDSGHFWMFVAGLLWLSAGVAIWPRPWATKSDETLAPNRLAAPVATATPRTPAPITLITARRPQWKTLYFRNPNKHLWISEDEDDNFYSDRSELIGAVVPLTASSFIEDMRARLTFYDENGKDVATVPNGCWVGQQYYNDVTLRVGDIGELLLLLYAQRRSNAPEYQIVKDKRNRFGKAGDEIDFEHLPVAATWLVKIELFYKGAAGQQFTFEFFSDSKGNMQLRNAATKETSD